MKVSIVFKKFLSVILAFTILNANIFAFDFDIKKEIAQIRADIARTVKPISDSDIRAKYRKEYNFKTLFKSIDEQGFTNNYGQVCDGNICAPYHTFMRGLIGALIDFSEGDGTIKLYARDTQCCLFGCFIKQRYNPVAETLKRRQ